MSCLPLMGAQMLRYGIQLSCSFIPILLTFAGEVAQVD